MNTQELQAMCQRIHEANKGWWTDLETGEPIKRSPRELAALVISELSEALEAERKDLMDDKLTHRKGAEVEMADAWIRVADMVGGFGKKMDDVEYPLDDVGADIQNKAEFIFYLMIRATYLVCPIGASHASVYWKMMKRIEEYCERYGYDLWGAIEEKLAYNAHREDHKIESRKLANGKKF